MTAGWGISTEWCADAADHSTLGTEMTSDGAASILEHLALPLPLPCRCHPALPARLVHTAESRFLRLAGAPLSTPCWCPPLSHVLFAVSVRRPRLVGVRWPAWSLRVVVFPSCGAAADPAWICTKLHVKTKKNKRSLLTPFRCLSLSLWPAPGSFRGVDCNARPIFSVMPERWGVARIVVGCTRRNQRRSMKKKQGGSAEQ